MNFPDSQMSFFREILGFTEQETRHVVDNAIQHVSMQFVLEFSN